MAIEKSTSIGDTVQCNYKKFLRRKNILRVQGHLILHYSFNFRVLVHDPIWGKWMAVVLNSCEMPLAQAGIWHVFPRCVGYSIILIIHAVPLTWNLVDDHKVLSTAPYASSLLVHALQYPRCHYQSRRSSNNGSISSDCRSCWHPHRAMGCAFINLPPRKKSHVCWHAGVLWWRKLRSVTLGAYQCSCSHL